jgi:hypothetical protein
MSADACDISTPAWNCPVKAQAVWQISSGVWHRLLGLTRKQPKASDCTFFVIRSSQILSDLTESELKKLV